MKAIQHIFNSRFSRVALYVAFVFASATIFNGCSPKDVSIPTGTGATAASPAYSGFTGATSAVTMSATKVKVSWNQASDPKVVAYNIYDSTLFFSPKLLKTVTGSASEVTLTGLNPQNYYSFRVRAADKNNEEDGNIKDLPAIPYAGVLPAEVLSSSSARIPFNDASNADSANVYCTTVANPVETLMATVTNVTTLSSATLTGLTPGIFYTCRAALQIGEFVDNNSVTTTFTPMGTAASLVFTTQPGSAAAGANLSTQPVVQILDANGTIVSAGPDSTAIISLTVASSSPTVGSIRGTASVAAVKGVATFTGLNFREAGAKIITATKEDTSSQDRGSATINQDSTQFTITPGAVSPTNSTIAISPAVPPGLALTANGASSYTVTITLADMYGNAISGTKPVFASNLSGDTMTQPTANTDINGQTTGSISTTIADTTPARLLNITSPAGLTTVTVAAPFVPGNPTKLAYTTQPTNSPAGLNGMGTVRVAVQDAQGNVVTSGTGATSTVSLAIAANVNSAILYGTTSVDAVNGVATFTGLGISKTGTGYKLLASSSSYTAAYSNSFNVTAGTPQKISITGPTTVLSGACSTALVFQLQDSGNNPANAVQNTPINLSGLGAGALYASSTCSGAPSSATLTFTAGTNTKTLYFKDNKGEAAAITASDPSMVLATATLTVNVSPNKLTLLAANADTTTPMVVVAGQCSTAIVVTPTGENGMAAPIFAPTTVSITGLAGTSATLYSDAACTTSVSPLSATLPITFGGSFTVPFYVKDNKAESLNLSVSDPNGILTTTSGLQALNILPSNIGFTGPVSVVSGACSSAFTVSLKDAQGNLVPASANRSFTINGLGGSTTGYFYFTPSCADAGTQATITVPQTNSSLQVYFKDSTAESLSIYLSDPTSQMANSPTINIGISPSSFKITAPVPATSKTTVCAGPFVINTLDGANNVTSAISTITADLTGAGLGGGFFSDSSCLVPQTQYIFTSGQSAKNFYFKGQYPQASATFTVSDQATVLASGSTNFAVTAALGFIGTASTSKDANGDTLWFQSGFVPVAARQDAVRSAAGLRFDSTKQYLYVADSGSARIHKYDYLNKKYLGWIGGFWSGAGIGISGSALTTPSAASCVAVTGWAQQTPGWCLGGMAVANSNTTNGNFNYPLNVAEDGAYIYVTNRNGHTVNRYVADTGAFAGWIGRISATPTGFAAGAPASCTSASVGSQTPGWCTGGGNTNADNAGDGGMRYPRAITASGGYVYVGSQGGILRFNASTGAFAGWIGIVGSTPPTSGAANCTTRASGQITPGWCYGGTSLTINPKSNGGGGVNDPTDLIVVGSTLYVVHTDSGGTINTYNVNTGAYQNWLPNLGFNWVSPSAITSDGTNFYLADWSRVIKVDPTGTMLSWIGKVSNNNSMSGNPGCSTLNPNDNTPGWCLGGSSKHGVDESAFNQATAIAYDGNGHIITGQGDNFPGLKMFNATTGVYEGSMGAQSISPSEWSNDSTLVADYYGFDDKSMYTPSATYNDGTHLFIAEANSARIKKVEIATGRTVGWIGGITTVPTGGDAGCTSANAMGPSPGWCLGALFNPRYLWNYMINQVTDGLMIYPTGITGDGTFLYVTDKDWHRIVKFNKATGAYVGWIGGVGTTAPIGGAPGCVGQLNGEFTAGWCLGGTPAGGNSVDGMMNQPTAITVTGGNLYVIDSYNHRVNSYNAATGAFNGWIGRINAAPTSGCTVASNGAYNVSVNGWCKGGTSQESARPDNFGGFSFWQGTRGGITTDGTNLYVANFYNIRVDKISLAGVYLGSASTRDSIYTRSWSNDVPTVTGWGAPGCSYPTGLHQDGTFIYIATYASCNNTNASVVSKMSLATGTVIGWKGAIRAGNSPTGGDAGCSGATSVTPGWCQNGSADAFYRLGQFSRSIYSVTGDSHFLYVTDENANRLTRMPK
jgi:hypothetical protein